MSKWPHDALVQAACDELNVEGEGRHEWNPFQAGVPTVRTVMRLIEATREPPPDPVEVLYRRIMDAAGYCPEYPFDVHDLDAIKVLREALAEAAKS